METKRKVGRPSIFTGRTERVTGFVTKEALRKIDGHRRVLAALAGFRGSVGDGDVVEFLAHGVVNGSEALRARAKKR